MKLFANFLLFTLCASSAQALETNDTYQQQAAASAALYRGVMESPLSRTQWTSHPYWSSDESFSTGDICFDGVIYRHVPLRYDIYRNQVAVLVPQSDYSVVPQQSRIQWFTLGDLRFVPTPDRRFAVQLYGSERLQLLHLRTKTYTNDITEGYRSYKVLEQNDSYLLLHDGQQSTVSSLKSLTRLFPQQKEALQQLAKREHLKFKKEKLEGSLISCTQLIDEALDSSSQSSVASSTQTSTGASQTSLPSLSAVKYLCVADSLLLPTSQLDTSLPAYYAHQPNAGAITYDETTSADASLTANLEPITEQHNLDEVEVTGFHQKISGVEVGVEKFRPALLKNVPLAMGEADVMKLLQTLPGVKTVGEASSGFNVRGGASDQNLILFNGSTIYNPMHLFGLFSAFNGDVIGETELYKSAISAQYGGRISSVMNIQSRVPDRKEWHGSASIGLLTAKAMLDAPLVKDKLSLLVSGRATYSDWMLRNIPEDSGYRDGEAGFYDVNASLAFTPNTQQRVTLYGYYSHDRFSFTPYDKYGYTNANGAINWRGRFGSSNRLVTDVTAGYDHYDYSNQDQEVPTNAARLSFDIDQYFLKATGNYQLNDQHKLLLGLHSIYYNVNPGKYEPVGDASLIALSELDSERALESALFIEDQWSIHPRVTLAAGVRYSLFNAQREGREKTYQAPEFRVSANWMLTDNQSIKLGFNTMHQYIHKVSNTSIMSPTDTWTLSNADIRPQDGWQLAAGYYLQTPDHNYEVTLEAYLKQMNNYLTYRSAGQLVMNPDLADDVVPMRGRAYGVELQLRKPYGKLTGWVSYSYSRTELRQDDGTASMLAINGGDWYAAEYDRPHELKLVANYKMTHRFSLSTNIDYSTGRPISVPAGQYYSPAEDKLLPYYTARNGYRLPDYFRVDASFNIEPGHHLTALFRHWFSIGVYNLLGRKNAYSVYYVAEDNHIQGYKLSIFGAPIPFVSYNLKF